MDNSFAIGVIMLNNADEKNVNNTNALVFNLSDILIHIFV